MRIRNAAMERVLMVSCSLSMRKDRRNNEAMITARWVDGDIPASSPYRMTGANEAMAAAFRVHACQRRISI